MNKYKCNFFLAHHYGYSIMDYNDLRRVLCTEDIRGLIKAIQGKMSYYRPIYTNDILEVSWG